MITRYLYIKSILLLFSFLMILSSTYTYAEGTKVVIKITVTKSSDIQNPIIKEIAAQVDTINLKSAMEANYSLHNRDSLFVHLVFYNKNYIANLKLNKDNPFTENNFIDQWHQQYSTGNNILFLFSKGDSDSDFKYKSLEVSDDMLFYHLFPEVLDFISFHVNQKASNKDKVKYGTKYLANAIKPVWDTNGTKKNAAQELVQESRYKKHHFNFFNDQWAGSSLLTLKPINTVTNEMISINSFKSQNRTIFPSINIYTNLSSIVESIEMTDETGVPYDYFEFENIDNNIQMYLDDLSITMVEQINNLGYYSEILSTAQWAWDIIPYHLRNTNNLRLYQPNDHFFLKMIKAKGTLDEGQIKPPWIGCYNQTYCNLYASDLSREIFFVNYNLFGDSYEQETYAPWGKHGRASQIHDAIKVNKNFVPLKVDDNIDGFINAWKYTNTGYVVYLTAYNRKYYTDPKPDNIHPGHIATCFPTRPTEITDKNWKSDAELIQAGETTGCFKFYQIWTSSSFSNGVKNGNRQQIQAHLYLGYIIKIE